MRALLLAGFSLFAGIAVPASSAFAAEGMWMPSQAPALAAKLKAAGLQLPPEALADMSAAPMNAIASLDGCSAAFLSPEGLVATNHHCAFGSIQHNSAPGRDLLTTGFLARTRDQELPAAPGSRILVMEALTDVSPAMLAGVTPKVTGSARTNLLEQNRKALIAACEVEQGRRCDVRSYFGGGTWYLQKMLEIRDVRLVHAPAGSVGNYGGEVDNWQWPRHTGDYSFYRAYVAPDGKPAGYASENVPYRPRGWLKWATTDLKDGDFVLIAGFPGETERYRTAAETRVYYERLYPLVQRLLADTSDLITRNATSEADRIAYAVHLQGADNYKKKIQGQMDVARSSDLIGTKAREGQAMGVWAARPENRRTHGRAIANYNMMVAEELAVAESESVNQTLNRAQLLRAARVLVRWASEQEKPDVDRAPGYQQRDRQLRIDGLNRIQGQFVPAIDRRLLEKALAETARLPEARRNLALEAALAREATALGGLDGLYKADGLADRAERVAWLDRPMSAFAASKDPFIRIALAALPADARTDEQSRALEGRMHAARLPYMAAVKAYASSEGRLLYPDANSSLRFTYGRVEGRPTEDGKAWTAFTTTRGLLEKETGKDPFDSPPALLEKVRARDWGGWASPALGTLPVNFLSTTDITNGNSGSAVLNAHGEFVGLAFDGTLEGMLSDWKVDEATNRTIAVDARYMGWVMEKVDGAGHLLREMGAPVSGAAVQSEAPARQKP